MLCIRCRCQNPDDSRLCFYCGKRKADLPPPSEVRAAGPGAGERVESLRQ